MNQSEYNKKRRSELKEKGLCTYCGKLPLVTKTLCEKCRQKYVIDSQQKRRSDRLSEGLCGQCGKRPLFTKTQCEVCCGKHKHYQKNRNDRCKSSGLCSKCGQQPPAESKTQCQSCLDKFNQHRKLIKDEVYQRYGGYKCTCCGETEPSFLTIDHINNDGALMRKEVHGEGTYSLYLWLMANDFPSEFQVLCWNCQWGKRKNNGICPHQIRTTS